ncbi:hypothetical protein J6590_077578 [Homalodisca vitripennis]|nr:hypothetical protein J6590_077578 [Homalodisca vitripennis]
MLDSARRQVKSEGRAQAGGLLATNQRHSVNGLENNVTVIAVPSSFLHRVDSLAHRTRRTYLAVVTS